MTTTSLTTVFIPSLLCSARLYEQVVPAAWGFGPTVIADTRRDDTIPQMAARLLDTIDGPFALVGVSMGGYIALETVAQAPDRVAALALWSTSARPDTAEQTAQRRQQVALVQDGAFGRLVDAAFGAIVAEENERDDRLRAWWRAMANDVGPEVFARQQEAVIARRDHRPSLGQITCPTLVLHGTGDRLIDPDNGRELAAGIPNADLRLLDRCGHSPTMEQPDAAARELAGLLSRVV